MDNQVNSFTETVKTLVEQTNVALEFAVKTNKSLTTQEDVVTMQVEQPDIITGDPSIVSYSVPSYNSTLNKVNSVLQTVDTFVKGEGKILLNDGTYREVKTIPVPISPAAITNLPPPLVFNSRSNWFFESMMFPQLTVSFDLKDKIDDRSDRVAMKRVIFDNFDDLETEWFIGNIVDKDLTYYETITLITDNGKKYWEDNELIDLPLSAEMYTGYFTINQSESIDNKTWYYLDTLNYAETSDEELVYNLQLIKGDKLRYNNSIYKIDQIEVTEKRVSLVSLTGMDHPVVYNAFEIYSEPFSEKNADIAIGYNECNSVFIKGINDDYNLLADDWGYGTSFYTNTLTYADDAQTLESYYFNNVVDFGKALEGEAKEKPIPALYGLTPNAPVITADQFNVNQINPQINETLDTGSIKNTASQIETIKSNITSGKATIAQQKVELVGLTDPAQRADLQTKIDANINQLNIKSIEYQSYVKSLATVAFENDSVSSSPKYHIRGFFEIPEGKTYTSNANERKQEIIQFEISYRYLKLDNTGNALNTYVYTDPSSGQNMSGTFSDWAIMKSSIKSKTFDEDLGYYTWDNENISDGTALNINQIDIPITKGEKVELKIRSISEAGWPTNPKKSEWSESAIISFPANLVGADQVTNILTDAIEEESQVKLNETLNATGVVSHLTDGYPNPNSGSGTYFKHQSRFLSYDKSIKRPDGTASSEVSIDLQSMVEKLSDNTFITISKLDRSQSIAITLQEYLQKMSDAISDPSVGGDAFYNSLENMNT